ncbi:MAG TPA: cytochrome o ubiquinol oxidase subunit III [Candidatus Paceibacterota bacterium]
MNEHTNDRVPFGFWVYLMSDCVLFAALFATYAVLRGETFGGPSGAELFSLPFVLAETIILLVSSATIGLAMLAAHHKKKKEVIILLLATFALGCAFLAMEVSEFAQFVREGHGWQQSAFLSSFFTLVGTHGLHIFLGSLWMLVLLFHLLYKGLTPGTRSKLMCLTLFWHFLDIVWIFIFTFVYLFALL